MLFPPLKIKKVRPVEGRTYIVRGATLILDFSSSLAFNASVRVGLVPLVDPFG